MVSEPGEPMKDPDQPFHDMATWMQELAEQFNQGCLEFVEDIEYCVTEAEATLETFLDPVWQWLDGLDSAVEEGSRPLLQTLAPAVQSHTACVGCRNYCGETYGGNLLVCAMHPYGVEEETCPDWESTWPIDQSKS
jgi:hypothetical protein